MKTTLPLLAFGACLPPASVRDTVVPDAGTVPDGGAADIPSRDCADASHVCINGNQVLGTFANVCQYSQATIPTSGFADDDNGVQAIVSRIQQDCTFHTMVVTAEDVPADSLVIVPGGPFSNPWFQDHQDRLQGIRIAVTPDNDLVYSNPDPVFTVNLADIKDGQDYLVVQAAVNPVDNQLVLVFYGVNPSGTAAAVGYAVQHWPLPNQEILFLDSGTITEVKQ